MNLDLDKTNWEKWLSFIMFFADVLTYFIWRKSNKKRGSLVNLFPAFVGSGFAGILVAYSLIYMKKNFTGLILAGLAAGFISYYVHSRKKEYGKFFLLIIGLLTFGVIIVYGLYLGNNVYSGLLLAGFASGYVFYVIL